MCVRMRVSENGRNGWFSLTFLAAAAVIAVCVEKRENKNGKKWNKNCEMSE